MIDEGGVDIFVDDVQIAQRGRGECLGEIALLRDSPRTATVIAATPLRLVELTRSDFLSGALAHPRSVHAGDALVDERLGVGSPWRERAVATTQSTSKTGGSQDASPHVVVLADARSSTEHALIAEWVADAHHGAELIRHDEAALARRLARGDDPLARAGTRDLAAQFP